MRKSTKNKLNRIFARKAAVPASAKKPKAPAITAARKNISAQSNMENMSA
jgi:hypothetical protein